MFTLIFCILVTKKLIGLGYDAHAILLFFFMCMDIAIISIIGYAIVKFVQLKYEIEE